MTTYQYDLHLHTTTSDGSLSYKELLELAKERGILGLSITDHNCVGPVEDMFALAKTLGIRFIPGVELKTTAKREIEEYKTQEPCETLYSIQELLVYGLDSQNPEFKEMSRTHLSNKKEYVTQLCKLLEQRSTREIKSIEVDEPIIIDPEDVIKNNGLYIGGSHVAQAIQKKYKGYSVNKALSKSDVSAVIASVSPAAQGLLVNDPFYSLDIIDGLKKAKSWGKVVVLAHPLTESRRNMQQFYYDALFPRLVENGLDGLEYCYPEHTEQELKFLEEVAKKFNLFLTGGSDFHSPKDSMDKLTKYGVTEEVFSELERRVNS